MCAPTGSGYQSPATPPGGPTGSREAAGEDTHPLKVEQVLLEGLPGLGLLALVDNVGVLFVPAALVILAAMGLPVS